MKGSNTTLFRTVSSIFLIFRSIFALKFAITWFKPLADLPTAPRLPSALYVLLPTFLKKIYVFIVNKEVP